MSDKDRLREDLIALMSQEDNVKVNQAVLTRGAWRTVRDIAARALKMLEAG